MRRVGPLARRWAFGFATGVAMAFGTVQAFAEPADAPARACSPEACNRLCQAQGGISGRCTSAGACICLF